MTPIAKLLAPWVLWLPSLRVAILQRGKVIQLGRVRHLAGKVAVVGQPLGKIRRVAIEARRFCNRRLTGEILKSDGIGENLAPVLIGFPLRLGIGPGAIGWQDAGLRRIPRAFGTDDWPGYGQPGKRLTRLAATCPRGRLSYLRSLSILSLPRFARAANSAGSMV